MALNTKGLTAPGDVAAVDGARIAASAGGHGAAMPTWGVGDPVVTAVAGFQKGMERFAEAYDSVQVNDYTTKVSQELDELYNNPDNGLFNTRKGNDAKGMYIEFAERAQEIWNKDAKDKLSDRQRGMASKHLTTLFNDYRHKIARHETVELMGAQINTCDNVVTTATNRLASGNFDVDDMANNLAAIRTAYRDLAVMKGWDAETAENKTREAFGSAIVKGTAALGVADARMAMGVLRTYKDYIPEDQWGVALESMHNRAKRQTEETYKERIAAGDREGAMQLLRDNSVNRGLSDHTAGGYTYPDKGPENDTPAYVDLVMQRTGLKADTVLDTNNTDQMAKLLHAMAQQESGLIKRSGLTVADVKHMLETGKDPEGFDYSKLGKDRAERNLNPGNLKAVNGEFKKFGSLAEGFRANLETLKRYQTKKGCEYLADYIYTWAPPTSKGWTVAQRKAGNEPRPVLEGDARFNGQFDNQDYERLRKIGEDKLTKQEVSTLVDAYLIRMNNMPAYLKPKEKRERLLEQLNEIPSKPMYEAVKKEMLFQFGQQERAETAAIRPQMDLFEEQLHKNPRMPLASFRQFVDEYKDPETGQGFSELAKERMHQKLDGMRDGINNTEGSKLGARKLCAMIDENPDMSEEEIAYWSVKLDLSKKDFEKAKQYQGRDHEYSQSRIDGQIDKVFGKGKTTESEKETLTSLLMRSIPKGERLTDKEIRERLASFNKTVKVPGRMWGTNDMKMYKAAQENKMPVPNDEERQQIQGELEKMNWYKQVAPADREKLINFMYQRDFLHMPVILSDEDRQMISNYEKQYIQTVEKRG